MRVDILSNPSKPGYFSITPYGPIDSDTHSEFKSKLQPIFKETTKGIVMDLANVDYISSAGLGVFFFVKKFMMEHGGEVVLCNLQPKIKMLFEIVKALPKETIFTSLEEADEYLYKMIEHRIEEEKKK